jgi:glycosyltransferase involved in cell wall biosynthesis
MVRFGIDFSAIGSPGTMLYCECLVPALSHLLSGDESIVLYVSREAARVVQSIPGRVEVTRVPSWVGGAMSRLFWGQTLLPWRMFVDKVDVGFAPFDISPLSAGVPMVVGVRNPMPLRTRNADNQESGYAVRRRVHERLTRRAVHQAVFASYPSSFAANYLGPLQGVPEHKRRVVPHGVDCAYWGAPGEPFPQGQLGLAQREYFLYVSQFYSYKNPGLAVDAFLRFRDQNPQSDACLILTGDYTATPSGVQTYAKAQASPYRDSIRFTGLIERKTLRSLYRSAMGLLMLTELETFGHPFVEAMAAGTPVLRLESEFGEELCGGASVVCRAPDVVSVCEAMERIAGDREYREAVVRSGVERVRQFSWDREAAETLGLLREAYRRQRAGAR